MIKTSIKKIRENLASYIKQVQEGQEIIITKREQPVAKLVPVRQKTAAKLQSHRELRSLLVARGKSLSQTVINNRRERF